nr:NAD-glutamate dehydrogenase domain-containing protein [Burkholderia multivorans]
MFLDPASDPATSFAERKRLFALERSSWADYDPAAISAGGGVYPRTRRRSAVAGRAGRTRHRRARAAADRADPRDPPGAGRPAVQRRHRHLREGEHETHQQVGDRANDAVRVNGADLRCKVVGEGGNLGFTQFGRIEFAQRGGRINTDAIDNSAASTVRITKSTSRSCSASSSRTAR